MVLHIAEEDLKKRYRPLAEQESRIEAFLKSISKTFDVVVQYEVKLHNTAAFTVLEDQEGSPVTKETKKTVLEFLLGELCDVCKLKHSY